jgi:hypothetical protein
LTKVDSFWLEEDEESSAAPSCVCLGGIGRRGSGGGSGLLELIYVKLYLAGRLALALALASRKNGNSRIGRVKGADAIGWTVADGRDKGSEDEVRRNEPPQLIPTVDRGMGWVYFIIVYKT